MGRIILKIKTELLSEEDMELGDKSARKSAAWVWRKTGIRSESIERVIRYDATKTLIRYYDGEDELVNERFDDVYKKWSESSEEAFPTVIEEIKDENSAEEEDEDEGNVIN